MLRISYTHIVTQGKQIFIVYVGGRANAVKYGSTLNSVFALWVIFFVYLSKLVCLTAKYLGNFAYLPVMEFSKVEQVFLLVLSLSTDLQSYTIARLEMNFGKLK